jgi:hypothetical protein
MCVDVCGVMRVQLGDVSYITRDAVTALQEALEAYLVRRNHWLGANQSLL